MSIRGNVLYTLPESKAFGAGEEKALAARLAEVERATQTPFVSSPAELQLDADGFLPRGYRYTETAFRQVCGLLCPGLHKAVVDLSGMLRTSDRPRSDYSFAAAVEIFNRAVRLRFPERFAVKVRLIKEIRHNLVEGALGPKYNYLENSAIYGLARDAMASSPVGVRFFEAILEGRRLLLRFVHDRPLFAITSTGDREGFFGGYHISNSEVGGEASVRVTTLLLRDSAGTTAMGPFPGRRPLAHTGKDFARKLIRLFEGVLAFPQDGPTLARRMQALADSPLDLGVDEKVREERVEDLSLLLHRQDVPRGLARRIVLSTAHYGGDPWGSSPTTPRRSGEGRTWFDLYCALTRESRSGLDITVMETVEQAAYTLLTSKKVRGT
jgi:hypothetical protein